jgi:hypothetical protein
MTIQNDLKALQKELKRLTKRVDGLQAELADLKNQQAKTSKTVLRSKPTKKTPTALINSLREYYNKHGISALKFGCAHKGDCQSRCDDKSKFTAAREPYIGEYYGVHGIPKLLFLSLDSGDESHDQKLKTIATMRIGNLKLKPGQIPKRRHWYCTHQFTWVIFDELNRISNDKWDIGNTSEKLFFEPPTDIYKIMPYFAHTNSAKCCLNKKGSKQADKLLFENCRSYIPGEIKLFDPHILVTQGGYARQVVEDAIEVGIYPLIQSKNISKANPNKSDFMTITVNDSRPVLWVHHYHPSNYGTFAKNYKQYGVYAKEAAKFIKKSYPELL